MGMGMTALLNITALLKTTKKHVPPALFFILPSALFFILSKIDLFIHAYFYLAFEELMDRFKVIILTDITIFDLFFNRISLSYRGKKYKRIGQYEGGFYWAYHRFLLSKQC